MKKIVKDKNNIFMYFCEYDQYNNLIHYKNSDEYECFCTYDKNNSLLSFKDSDGYEYFYEYDDKGNRIHFIDSEDNEYFCKYDDKGNRIYCRNDIGEDIFYEEHNTLIYHEFMDDKEYIYEYED